MLELSGLTIYRAASALPTVRSVSASFFPGQVVGVCGANGSGKSTMFEALAGAESLRYEAHQALLNTLPLVQAPVADVCYLPQVQPFIAHDLARCFLDFSNWSRDLAMQFEISDFLSSPIGALSQGQWKRVQCVAHFSQACRLRLLDEPESALDRHGKVVLSQCLRKCKQSSEIVLVASHDLHFLKGVCDAVMVLEKGKLVWYSNLENFQSSLWAVF